MNSEKLIFEQGNLFDEHEKSKQANLFEPEDKDSSVLYEESDSEDGMCEHGKEKVECEACNQLFENEMLRLQRQQMIEQNKEEFSLVLNGELKTFPNPDYQDVHRHGKSTIFPINHPTGDKTDEVIKYKRFGRKLRNTIGNKPLSTEELNKSLEKHFGVKMKVNSETHYPDQKTITIEGVTCNIRSDSHRRGFYLKVPNKKNSSNKNNNMRKIG